MIKISKHEIKDSVGIHARPAGKLAALLKPYTSKVTLVFDEKEVDAKSLLAVMKTGIKCGNIVSFVIEGEDEEAVNAVLLEFLKTNL
jgi:phosphotransferase system HPr (HPr) family protein